MALGLENGQSRVLVLMLESQGITRDGLQLLLHDCPDFGVVQMSDRIEEAEKLARETAPHVVLIAFGSPLCAIRATRRLRAITSKAHVIVLSSRLADSELAELLRTELRQAGACGLLPSSITCAQLREALCDCLMGRDLFDIPICQDPAAINSTAKLAYAHSRPLDRKTLLSQRQSQVLQLVAKGLLNKEIADRLGISMKTVEKHRQSLKGRLRATNTADLTRHAIELGLV